MHSEMEMEKLKARVVCIARRASRTVGDGYPQLVSTWRSRTATLHRFRVEDSSEQDVLVKLHDRPEDAYAQFNSMCEIASVVEELPQGNSVALRPLGFSEDLGAVIMPYVSGVPLAEQLQRQRWTPRHPHHEIMKLVSECGVILARYHSKTADRSGPSLEAAWDDLQGRIGNVLGDKAEVRRLAMAGMVAKSYGDFHPGHIIVTDSRNLVLLDPPLVANYKYVYRDLAWFTYNLFMIALHPSSLQRGLPRIHHHTTVANAFLHAYAGEMGHPLSDDDRFFVNGCEAFMLRRRLSTLWRSRSYALLAYYLAPIGYRYFLLRRSMLRHLRLRVPVSQS